MVKEKETANGSADRELVISRTVNAPRELVWQAMTDPHHVVHWWGPRGFSTTIEEMDVRPGGVWNQIMHGPDGSNFINKGIFREVVKPERLMFTQGGNKEGGLAVSFESTWTFETVEAGKTRVTIRMVFISTAERDRVVEQFGAREGAHQTLERLSEHLVTMELSGARQTS